MEIQNKFELISEERVKFFKQNGEKKRKKKSVEK